jgi:ascorbate PTS system EIIB component
VPQSLYPLYIILYIAERDFQEGRITIKRVSMLAVCGMGFGTSLMMLMNVQDLGKKHGIDVKGEAVDLGSAKGRDVDLIVASSEIAGQLSGESARVVALNNLVDKEEMERKVLPVLKEVSGG